MSAAEIEIYTQPLCGYCTRAKKLLDGKGVTYKEIDLFSEPVRRREMMTRSGGRRTVPQIFIGATHVGGCDELLAAEHSGELDKLLQAAELPAGDQ